MKAAVYYETGDPDVFRYEEAPDPKCYPRGVLIEMQTVSIEGGDVLSRAGGEMASTPHIVGYQSAGVIREVGSEVDDRELGQRVVTVDAFGSHAELRSVPVTSSWVVPDALLIEEAACVPIPFGTAEVEPVDSDHLRHVAHLGYASRPFGLHDARARAQPGAAAHRNRRALWRGLDVGPRGRAESKAKPGSSVAWSRSVSTTSTHCCVGRVRPRASSWRWLRLSPAHPAWRRAPKGER